MARNNPKILDAKRALYAVLLNTPHGELTEHEADLVYALASDQQIQDFLIKNRDNKEGGTV